MKTIKTPKELRQELDADRRRGFGIGFVPTMGCLHRGHLSLIEAARRECDRVVVSIFVNPLQFGPQEDLGTYPRDVESDEDKCQQAGCDYLFIPDEKTLYPNDFQTHVEVKALSQGLCGAHRPGHFLGVTTVVAKLFNWVEPQAAFFGEKDYQQLQVVRQMVRDLNFPVRIVGLPTVREPDGLAMSSRNAYLDETARRQARIIPQSLFKAQEQTEDGIFRVADILHGVRLALEENPHLKIEYIEIVDPQTLEPLETVGPGHAGVLVLAVNLRGVRLIDNVLLGALRDD